MNTRTKHKEETSIVVSPANWQATVPDVGVYSDTLVSELVQKSQDMTDMKRALRRKHNSCDHAKGELLSIASRTGPHYASSTVRWWNSVDVGSQLWFISKNPALLRAKEKVQGDSTSQAEAKNVAYYMQRLKPKAPKVLSIINFLVELDDTKRLFQLWSSKYGFLHNIANVRLGYEYGWKLFLQDVVSILDALLTVEKRIKKFLDGQGEVRNKRVRVPLSDIDRGLDSRSIGSDNSFLKLTNPGYPEFEALQEENWLLKKDESYETASMRFSYFIPELSACSAQVGFLLGAFGVEWNPRIIWDAIPYTFVIDWFISVGEFLEQWGKVDNVPIHVRVHDFSITRKADVRTQVRWKWKRALSPIRYEYHEVLCHGTYYRRMSDLQSVPQPDDLVNAGFTRIGQSRFLNALALLVTNTRMPAKPLPRKPHKVTKKRKNPILGKGERNPKVRFVWPERPYYPKYSKEFLDDFRLLVKDNQWKAGTSIDGSANRNTTAWAVRYKRLEDDLFNKRIYIQ